ncbi:hypothetical protein [Polynucleobacter sp.]
MKLQRKKIIKPNFWQKEQVNFSMFSPGFILAVALPDLYKKYEEMGN